MTMLTLQGDVGALEHREDVQRRLDDICARFQAAARNTPPSSTELDELAAAVEHPHREMTDLRVQVTSVSDLTGDETSGASWAASAVSTMAAAQARRPAHCGRSEPSSFWG